MKNTKMLTKMFAAMLVLALCFTTSNAFAQTKAKGTMTKDCCMMKNGKMVMVKDGKTMPMDKDMKMSNGTTCMVNGECIMKDGKKMTMKEGDCMDMSGKMDKCTMMNKSTKKTAKMKTKKNNAAAVVYTCPMHPEVTSDKPGKCPKCGMTLEEKK